MPDGPRELPRTGVLGIPANPWDPEVRRSLGLAGSLRASLDKLLPASLGTTAEATSVSALVRARMGRRVLERLVAPVVGGVHSADPDVLDIDMVAPGLRAGIRARGSLAAAVAAQRNGTQRSGNQRNGGALPPAPSAGLQKAGSAVAGLRGGMHTLISALLAELRSEGVTLLGGTRADAVARTADGWRVSAGGTAYDAGLLVVAVEGPAAVGLLTDALPDLAGRRPDAGARCQPGHAGGGPAPARRQAAGHRSPGGAAEPGNPGQGPHPRHRQMGLARRPGRPRHPRCPAVLRTR